MNYDEYLLEQQNNLDNRTLNEVKIWVVFDENKKIVESSAKYEGLKELLFQEGDELGWVWEKDFYPKDDEKTYKLLNTIEND